MAGKKRSLTIEFLGEAKTDAATKKVAQGIKGVGDAADKTSGDLKGLDTAADKAATSLKGVGDDADRAQSQVKGLGDQADRAEGKMRGLDRVVGQGGRTFGDYGTGLGGIGDRFDELDTRAMGVADGFAGIADASKWSTLTLQEQAMVASDLGSAMYNAVIPSLQGAAKAGKNFLSAIGGIKGLLVGGGIIAGVGALGYAIKSMDDAANAKTLENFAREASRGAEITSEAATAFFAFAGGADEVKLKFREFADAAGPDAARALYEVAGSAHLTDEEMAALTHEMAAIEAETGDATEKINDQAEAFKTLEDRVTTYLGVIQAVPQAQRDVDEGTLSLAEQFRDTGTALDNLSQEGIDNQNAIDAQVTAIGELITAMQNHGATSPQMQAALQQEAADLAETMRQAGFSEAAIATYTEQILSIPTSASTNVNLYLGSTFQTIEDLKWALATIPAEKTIAISTRVRDTSGAALAAINAGREADGGIVPDRYAAGGVAGWFPGGPRGTDTVPAWLTPGEMVLNDAQQAELWDLANGGGTGGGVTVNVNVDVHGSVTAGRDLIAEINRAADKGAKIAASAVRGR